MFKAKNLRGRGQFSRGRQRFHGGRCFGQGNRFASNWNWNNWNNRRGQNQNYQNYGYGQFQPPIQQQQGPNQPQAQANLIYVTPTINDKFGYIGMFGSPLIPPPLRPGNKNISIFFIDSAANRICMVEENILLKTSSLT